MKPYLMKILFIFSHLGHKKAEKTEPAPAKAETTEAKSSVKAPKKHKKGARKSKTFE